MINQLLKVGLELADLENAILIAVILSGLLLNRISPTQLLKTLVFLAISTKVELILVAVLLSDLTGPSTWLPIQSW